jgi:hypothetical protein
MSLSLLISLAPVSPLTRLGCARSSVGAHLVESHIVLWLHFTFATLPDRAWIASSVSTPSERRPDLLFRDECV